MTVTFSVTYEIPVSPERIAEIEAKMAHVIATVDPPDEAERQVAMLQRLMVPERRTEPANMRHEATIRLDTLATGGGIVNWECQRCNGVVAKMRSGEVSAVSVCPGCGAIVTRQDLPMTLDLYRMRTRRNDGVEVQSK